MKNLHVCYTVNSSYLNPLLVSIYSLLENNLGLNVYVYIIYENLSLEEQRKIDKVVAKFPNGHLQMYDIKYTFPEIEQYNIPTWRGTKIANARLFLSKIIPNCPDTILYLDSDTIIVGNLSPLINHSYKAPIYAVLDPMSKEYLNSLNPKLKKYFNSGVLKIDYNLWENNKGEERILNTIKENYPLTFPDQDILNIAFRNKIGTLPLSYNLFPINLFYDIFTLQKFYRNNQIDFYSKECILNSRKRPKILHAINFYQIRPWEQNRIHPYQSLYLQYIIKIYGNSFSLEQSNIPYANMDPRLFKFIEYLKIYTPKDVKNGIKKILKK